MILITGYKGFIGSHFVNALKDKPLLKVEIEDAKSFIDTFSTWDKVDLIIHQGAISSTTEKDIEKLHYYNVTFTLKLLEKAIKYKMPVKYASSASVYGNTKNTFNPLNYYAITKLQIDYFVTDNLDKFSLIQGFRFFNVYGTNEEHKKDQASPVSKFTAQIKDKGKLKLFASSDKFLRDFVCVDDIVSIVLNNDASSGIYDLGTANPISFKDIAELIVKKEGGEIEIIPFPSHLVGKYQTYTCADMSWLGNKFSFKTVKEYLNI